MNNKKDQDFNPRFAIVNSWPNKKITFSFKKPNTQKITTTKKIHEYSYNFHESLTRFS